LVRGQGCSPTIPGRSGFSGWDATGRPGADWLSPETRQAARVTPKPAIEIVTATPSDVKWIEELVAGRIDALAGDSVSVV